MKKIVLLWHNQAQFFAKLFLPEDQLGDSTIQINLYRELEENGQQEMEDVPIAFQFPFPFCRHPLCTLLPLFPPPLLYPPPLPPLFVIVITSVLC